MSKNKVLAVVSRTLPPMVIGSAILLHNLFESYKGRVIAVSGWQLDAKIDDKFKLKAERVHHLKSSNKLVQKIFERRSQWVRWIIQRFVYNKLRKGNVDAVLGVCPNGEYFVAAFNAATKLNIPFYAHMHDLWIENLKPNTPQYALAAEYEAKILQSAKRVFCMTDVQRKHYEEKYGIQCELLPHTIKAQDLPSQSFQFDESRYRSVDRTIVYTGNVNRPINIDAMQQFIRCIDDLPDNFQIKVFISLNEAELRAIDIYHPRVQYDWKSMEEVKKELKKAHLLFLPLSFKNCSPLEVKTVFATKTLDYLTSGTPILQYSPLDSFHTQSALKGNWAKCITEDNTKALTNTIISLSNDIEECKRLVNGAIQEAYSRKSDIHSDRLLSFLESDLI